MRTYGTRDDFLIPFACLNSTVSGLISRTVLRSDLIRPDEFHGAEFYRELVDADVSGLFLDTVEAHFAEATDSVAYDAKALSAADRSPTWEGWATAERISEEYGIGDVNLVKPGVGETTRVLLRRVPWKILIQVGGGPTWTTYACSLSSAASPWRRWTACPTPASGSSAPATRRARR